MTPHPIFRRCFPAHHLLGPEIGLSNSLMGPHMDLLPFKGLKFQPVKKQQKGSFSTYP